MMLYINVGACSAEQQASKLHLCFYSKGVWHTHLAGCDIALRCRWGVATTAGASCAVTNDAIAAAVGWSNTRVPGSSRPHALRDQKADCSDK